MFDMEFTVSETAVINLGPLLHVFAPTSMSVNYQIKENRCEVMMKL